MAIGTQYNWRIVEDATSGVAAIAGLTISTFSHDGSFSATATAVVKEDTIGTINDAFRVKVSYPEGSAPAMSVTMATHLANCVSAINTAFPTGGAGAST